MCSRGGGIGRGVWGAVEKGRGKQREQGWAQNNTSEGGRGTFYPLLTVLRGRGGESEISSRERGGRACQQKKIASSSGGETRLGNHQHNGLGGKKRRRGKRKRHPYRIPKKAGAEGDVLTNYTGKGEKKNSYSPPAKRRIIFFQRKPKRREKRGRKGGPSSSD